jgi:predicted RecB family endonuclease
MSNTWVIIIAIGGMIVSPLVSIIGILISEKRQKKRDLATQKKEKKELEIKESEIQQLINKSSIDALASYSGVIASLRVQVDDLVEVVNDNTREITSLVNKLNIVGAEKERLALENIQLLSHVKAQDVKIEEQSMEIAELRKKIVVLESK